MSTVRAGSRTGWWSFAIVDPGVRWPFSTVKTLVDGWPVWMKEYPTIPTLEVQSVSKAAEGIEPLRTPSSRSCSMSILAVESVRGVEILAAPMSLACSPARDVRVRLPLGGVTRSGAVAADLSADCSARHCRPSCRTLY